MVSINRVASAVRNYRIPADVSGETRDLIIRARRERASAMIAKARRAGDREFNRTYKPSDFAPFFQWIKEKGAKALASLTK